MITDVLTVMWKERKGLLRYQGSRTRALLGLLIPAVMLGIYLPLQIGRALVEGPWSLLASVFVPMMMVGMMVPSAAPAILLFAAISRKNQEQQPSLAPVGAFAWGYVLTWTGFSLAATSLQWGLEQAALLSPMMVSTSPVLGGLLLAAAGLYQMTPLKESCLVKCRSPLHFLVARWRPGSVGALRMGLEHGAFCVGCCWLLMGLLFFGGVMNLAWVAAIAIFVLIEKVMPWGSGIGRAGGILLIAGGLLVAFQP